MHEYPYSDLMQSHGYAPYHTGGGCMAWRKDVDGGYLLITSDDNSLHRLAGREAWTAGRYVDSGEGYGWIITREFVTLREAIARAESLPRPNHDDEREV